MDTITYLLGAGASAQSLPLVKDLSKRVKYIRQVLLTEKNRNRFTSYIKIGEDLIPENQLIDGICNDLLWMETACDKHSSIDTFAKKLFILKSTDYERLKTILSVYFTLEQKFNSPDLRYDNFWASILDTKNVFPPNLRLISWNYDFQLEQSYLNFSDTLSLGKSYANLSIRSFFDPKRDNNSGSFAVYKLNGSATISKDSDRPEYFSDDLSDEKIFYEKLLTTYAILNRNSYYRNNLSFAWEHDLKDSYFDELKQSLWLTKTLVIVGYSFPYFNRKIDRYLVNECMPFLEKVYFQAPDANNLKERFSVINNSLQDKNLLLRTDLDQFTFPNEL